MPAFIIPDPLSIIIAGVYSLDILKKFDFYVINKKVSKMNFKIFIKIY